VIRRLTSADAPELTCLLAENRAFLAPFEPDWPDDFLTVDVQRERIRASEHLYAILDDGTLSGTIALSNLVRGVFDSATVGYWVERARNGRGLATGAVSSIVELAFTELGLHRLEAGTLVDNVASQRVLEKNRFTRIGLAPRYLCIAGAWRDHVLYQRTVED
jgi:ribosomal-protein-alanine N-acetyltransferase